MADVKWIKLSTQMFDDEKIRLIEQMPEADTILIIWVKLLAQAGKTNASGYIYLSEKIPYTEEMLATIFNRSLPIVRLALSTFQQFGMIEVSDDKFIAIANWEKHQSVTGLDKIREQNRKRVAEHRKRKKELGCNVTRNGNVTDIERELDKELDKEKEVIPYVEIVTYLNDATSKNYRYSTKKTKDLIKARWNEGFTLNDFKKVIDIKCREWLNNPEMNNFLRPETLFGTKFEGYLNQQEGKSGATNQSTSYDGYNFDKEFTPNF
ncbi:phage replisome organizer N-terminal domain-containing protein [Alkalihalophilus marmarensis]|uniref:phage replisome organizer N-terminal domain-containing protein n=1 Tax=Alkalihalophilus marmarensis TaxID=521377 RepID=UPI002E21632D|nr:phage replisome organizer N-terminal domain-containing protein [Alkalihalophilus marmarensis]